MTTIPTKRCSSLDRELACPASQVEPAIRIVPQLAEARLGSAFHLVAGGWPTEIPMEVAEAAKAFDVADLDDLERLCRMGFSLWRQIQPWFPEAQVEVPLGWADEAAGEPIRWPGDRYALTGHADLVALVGEEFRAGDWKTGFADLDCRQQLRGYALLGTRETGLPRALTARIGVREGTWEPAVTTREEAEEWWRRAQDRLDRTEEYNPGAWCQFCPRAHECPARQQMVAEAITVVLQPGSGGPQAVAGMIDGDQMATLLAVARLAVSCGEQIVDFIREQVQAAGGTLGPLTLERQERHPIDTAAALPVLRAHLPEEAVLRCTRLSKTDVEKEVKLLAPARQKGKVWAALLQKLEAADAFQTTYSERLVCRRTPLPLVYDERPEPELTPVMVPALTHNHTEKPQ